MFATLTAEIEDLEIPLDGDALTEILGVADRLDARITDALGLFDAAELWELDGATSLTAWLADRAAMVRRRAAAVSARARKLAVLPATMAAWREGALSGGRSRPSPPTSTARPSGCSPTTKPR